MLKIINSIDTAPPKITNIMFRLTQIGQKWELNKQMQHANNNRLKELWCPALNWIKWWNNPILFRSFPIPNVHHKEIQEILLWGPDPPLEGCGFRGGFYLAAWQDFGPFDRRESAWTTRAVHNGTVASAGRTKTWLLCPVIVKVSLFQLSLR